MSNWQEGYAETNGIRIHYHRTGGDKPQLLFAHGVTDSGLCWGRLARALEADYDCILVDARGHGHSDKPTTGYTADDHAADLAGLIDALALDCPVVIGHSMGGNTATARATLGTPEERAERAAQWRQNSAAMKAMSAAEIEAMGRERSPLWADEEFPAWVAAKQRFSMNIFDTISRVTTPWQESAARFRSPVLLVTAETERGAIVSAENAAEAVTINPLIRLAHIDGAGHNIRRENFDAFVAAVRPFLAELHK
jgi:N-formylmaleamate deformylase